MGHLGADAAAANSVAAVVRDVVCCLSGGISGATGIMVGNELGAGNLEQGKSIWDPPDENFLCVRESQRHF